MHLCSPTSLSISSLLFFSVQLIFSILLHIHISKAANLSISSIFIISVFPHCPGFTPVKRHRLHERFYHPPLYILVHTIAVLSSYYMLAWPFLFDLSHH